MEICFTTTLAAAFRVYSYNVPLIVQYAHVFKHHRPIAVENASECVPFERSVLKTKYDRDVVSLLYCSMFYS